MTLLALAWAFFFTLWPGWLGCGRLLSLGTFSVGPRGILDANHWKFKGIILDCNCRRWAAEGGCADCTTCFHGSKMILHFLLLADPATSLSCPVSWGFFLLCWEWTCSGGLETETCGVACGYGRRLMLNACGQTDLIPLFPRCVTLRQLYWCLTPHLFSSGKWGQ